MKERIYALTFGDETFCCRAVDEKQAIEKFQVSHPLASVDILTVEIIGPPSQPSFALLDDTVPSTLPATHSVLGLLKLAEEYRRKIDEQDSALPVLLRVEQFWIRMRSFGGTVPLMPSAYKRSRSELICRFQTDSAERLTLKQSGRDAMDAVVEWCEHRQLPEPRWSIFRPAGTWLSILNKTYEMSHTTFGKMRNGKHKIKIREHPESSNAATAFALDDLKQLGYDGD